MSGHPFKVKAVFEYNSGIDEDLSFPEGQIITVTEDDEPDWYTGEFVDAAGEKREGIFPRNFVEKYEPTAPPRPSRAPRPKKEVEVAPTTLVSEPAAPKDESQQPAVDAQLLATSHPPEPPLFNSNRNAGTTLVSTGAPPPKAVATATKPSGPPPVSEKPSGGSFRDRIAAFNKSAAPPPAPFKPGGLSSGGTGFIKKPFVAPPPSKDAYVPPPREAAVQKIYRRDEDPEIAAKEAENQENAERAGLAPTANEGEEGDQPKPTSLKERIALLQKQQMEQAARHAEAAQKKEKPKRPAKKRVDSHNINEGQEEEAPLEKLDSRATIRKSSMDLDDNESSSAPAAPKRKASKGPPGLPRESFGDGNEADMSGAGDETEDPEEVSTGRDDSDEKPKKRATMTISVSRAASMLPKYEAPADEDEVDEATYEEGGAGEDEGLAEEENVDPEVRRKEELRARMAKMSAGMGMYGMLGGGMPMPGPALPPKKKTSGTNERQSSEHAREVASSSYGHPPPVPGVVVPGLSKVKSPEESKKQLQMEEEDDDSRHGTAADSRLGDESPRIEDARSPALMPPKIERPKAENRQSYAAPPVPGGRPAPPPVPIDTRPPPLRIASTPSPSAGSESDDEMSLNASKVSVETSRNEVVRGIPPRPTGPPVPSRPGEELASPRSPPSKRASYFATETGSSPSAITPGGTNKRASRVPPIPGSSPIVSPQARAPPPPPPGAPLSRSSTGDTHILPFQKHDDLQQEEDEEEVTEYEGDYDTDIASPASHKDVLKSYAVDSSMDDIASFGAAAAPPSGALPPLPPQAARRPVPPPPPSQPPPSSRQSADIPRAAPPQPPPRAPVYEDEDDEYDPYRYAAAKPGRPAAPPPTSEIADEEDFYDVSPKTSRPKASQERAAPPPPPREPVPQPSSRAPLRQSSEAPRLQPTSRKSTDMTRMSMDSAFVASDVDLGQGSLWWVHPNSTPPVFQNRKDILHETEESTTTKRGGKSTTTRDLYILFQDYSQTVITVRYDPANPSDASFEQRHEQPPSRLRQDQLEASYGRFGRAIAEAVISKKDTVVGDGDPHALITELLRPFPDALLPVGTRSYGAIVYANMANASTLQNDEIRPGDIITLRNARFQGKHGPMHAKYSMEVGGATGHVAVVGEWDGTKKKVRAWEQGPGRGNKGKVGSESYKLDDLRSGEVKIWRVMSRGWVGWEGTN